MIGQRNIQATFEFLIEDDRVPKFMILCGNRGAGKKMLARQVAHEIVAENGYVYELPDLKIDTVRKMIEDSYKVSEKTIYLILDADTMSQSAQNALLKITEEPAENATFIMTVNNSENLLRTIRSRAELYNMELYSMSEIIEYITENNNNVTNEEKELIGDICDTPGEAQLMYDSNALEFYAYVEKVYDNIATVSEANAFKIADKLAIKTDSTGYDLTIFFKIFINMAISDIYQGRVNGENVSKLADMVKVTSRIVSQLSLVSVNKQMLFDKWIIEVRNILAEQYGY